MTSLRRTVEYQILGALTMLTFNLTYLGMGLVDAVIGMGLLTVVFPVINYLHNMSCDYRSKI